LIREKLLLHGLFEINIKIISAEKGKERTSLDFCSKVKIMMLILLAKTDLKTILQEIRS